MGDKWDTTGTQVRHKTEWFLIKFCVALVSQLCPTCVVRHTVTATFVLFASNLCHAEHTAIAVFLLFDDLIISSKKCYDFLLKTKESFL
jgi:hypothetical protein